MTFSGTCGVGRQRSLTCFIEPSCFREGLRDLSDRALQECLDVKSVDVLGGLRRLLHEQMRPDFASPLLVDAMLTTIAVDLIRHLRDVGASGTRRAGLARGGCG